MGLLTIYLRFKKQFQSLNVNNNDNIKVKTPAWNLSFMPLFVFAFGSLQKSSVQHSQLLLSGGNWQKLELTHLRLTSSLSLTLSVYVWGKNNK